MAFQATQQYPASPVHGDPELPMDPARKRCEDPRRLRRVKDSREQLKKRSRARAASSGTLDTTASNSSSAGRSYTVANVHNGVIYLRYVPRLCCYMALFCVHDMTDGCT